MSLMFRVTLPFDPHELYGTAISILGHEDDDDDDDDVVLVVLAMVVDAACGSADKTSHTDETPTIKTVSHDGVSSRVLLVVMGDAVAVGVLVYSGVCVMVSRDGEVVAVEVHLSTPCAYGLLVLKSLKDKLEADTMEAQALKSSFWLNWVDSYEGRLFQLGKHCGDDVTFPPPFLRASLQFNLMYVLLLVLLSPPPIMVLPFRTA